MKFNYLIRSRVSHLACILVFISSLFSPVFAQTQLGKPKITNYTYLDYEGDPDINFIAEDNDGLMYFTNYNGLLIFDGVNWKLIEFNYLDLGLFRSLMKGPDGLMYYASSKDIGFLDTNESGEMVYHSLKNKIPKEHRDFTDMWDIIFHDGKIFFFETTKLFIWEDGEMRIIPLENSYHITAKANGKIYTRFWDKGLTVFDGEEFKLVPGGERFANERVYVILPYDEKRLLLGVINQGFLIYDGNNFEPLVTDIDDKIKSNLTYPGRALENGNFVINTNGNGAFLIDHEGKLIHEYNVESGLEGSFIRNVFIDSRGLLWLTTSRGISNVDVKSPFKYLGSKLPVVSGFTRYNNTLFISTQDGIYYIDEDSQEIVKIPNSSSPVNGFIEIHGHLYAAPQFIGIVEVQKAGVKIIREIDNFDYRILNIIPSVKNPNRFYARNLKSFDSYLFNEKLDKLELESRLEIQDNWKDIVKLSNSDNIWIPLADGNEIIRMSLANITDKLDFKNIKMDTLDAPNPNYTIQKFFENEYIISENQGAYLYNDNDNKFIKTKIPYGDNFNMLYGLGNSQDKDNKIFYSLGDGISVANKIDNDSIVINSNTFQELNKMIFYSIFPENIQEDGTQLVWFAGIDGIVRYEGNLDRSETPDINVHIRSISTSNDSLIYSGAGNIPNDLNFEPKKNSFVFNYAAPIYKNQQSVTYSTQLEGLDNKWSEWTKQPNREYLNLKPGSYTFKVKAKNIYGDESEEATFSFSIATPWFRTWWAYLLYALGAILLVYAIVRQRTKLLRYRQDELEESVDERTKEVQKRMNELATVNHVSQALTEKLKLNELIQLVGDEMRKLFKSDITYLALVDGENDIINFPYQDGDTIAPQKFGRGLTSKIITTGEPLLINKDADIDAEYKKIGVAQSGKPAISYLGVPIPSEDKIIGVLSVQSTEQESRFNEEDKRLLNTIAINVGIAIHNAELYEQARLAKLKAEEANEAKSAFLSTVSHELRTPLTSVLGFAKIIRKRLEDKIFPAVNIEDQKIKRTMKQVNENLNVVISEGERLTTLINDVLDLAKIESGKMEWNMKPIFLQDSINRALASTQSLFDQKNLKLKKKIPSDLPLVNADEDKIIQVVINLVSNAVKFTDSGKVEIEAYQDKDQIIVEVKDTGIGIAEEDHYKVFEKFRQAGDTLTDKPKGTGLGLPICREIVEHHGGIIWMTSEPNVGSTFYFSLPVLSQTAEPKPVQLDRILTSLKKQIKHSAKNADSKKAPTILVVDDATPIRSLLRQELTETGYLVKEAADGKMALDMVRYSKPDLIILDVMMPEINGFDVAAVLKNDPATMDIPIIILSIVQDKERGLRIGVDRYLTKPINTEQLFHEVDVLLEQGVSKKKVLVVDEDASAVNTLSEVLSARGYKVMNSNGKNIFETAKESQPDIIMLNSVYNGDHDLIKDIKLQKGMENVMFFIYE